jgi:hypothetical protein
MPLMRIADNLELPIGAVTQKIALLARSGAGKTNTAVVIVEELLAAGQQVVILDPPGAWWGLRSSADGRKPGYPVVRLGGLHGDVPLEPSAGAVVADLVVDHGLSAVIDLSEFTDSDMARFAGAFAQRLYARKNQNRDPMMLVLEEADELAPQNPKGEGPVSMMLHHIERIAKRGRMRGIGLLMISQRSAALNKHVLSQAEVMVAMQTTAPQDIAAIDDWVKSHGDAARRQQLLSEIAGLPVGAGFVWSPSWLGIFQRVTFRKRRTFDSSATPEPGQWQVAPKTLADVDLTQLQQRMTATIEKAKAGDPRELRKRIADLERQVAAKPTSAEPQTITVEKPVPVSVLTPEDRLLLGGVHGDIKSFEEHLAGVREMISRLLTNVTIRESIGPMTASVRQPVPRIAPVPRSHHRPPPMAPAPRPEQRPDSVSIGKAERVILGILAQYPDGRTNDQLALLAGYSSRASTIGVALSKLRRLGYVEPSGVPRITEAGRDAAGPIDELPRGADLLAYWRQHPRVGAGERKVLDVLVERYPEEIGHEELCALTGYSPTASTVGVALSKLRKLGLVETGARRAASEFMEAIA